tara:strand:+ start:2759 stop:3637 length:879 start_codon:yes stop_codon:yes gene_type:complete
MSNKYPVYIISKGRHDVCFTADMFKKYKVPFKIVVEPQEFNDYSIFYDQEILIKTPFSNLGLGSIPARNFVWEHSKELGAKRHWIFDDNIRHTRYFWNGRRIIVNPNIALNEIEKFTDRYTNIAISGMNYTFFVNKGVKKPYWHNNRVFSNLLIDNSLDFRWRGRYNEDTDLFLQAMAKKYCTVLFNVFMIDKNATLTMKGGNMGELYKGDGRLRMARDLEEQWPGVVKTVRKYGRPQHEIVNKSLQFDTPLIRRTDIDWDNIAKEKLQMKIIKVDEIESERLELAVDNYNE